MDVTLYIGNLSEATNEDDLLTLFTHMGDVSTLRIMRDRHSGRSRGYAYVTMTAQSEADKAVSRLNESSFHGQTLKVILTRPRSVTGIARALNGAQRLAQKKKEE
jgi:RNA recognition motif-containing protein